MIDRLRDVLGLPRPDVAKPTTADELREAQELRSENKRHVDAIERHVSNVSERIRAQATEAHQRAQSRR